MMPDKDDFNTQDAPDQEEDGTSVEKEKELTPDEQMELYEESLKESDWGHQPC